MKPGDLVQHGYSGTVYLETWLRWEPGQERISWHQDEIGVLLECDSHKNINGLREPMVKVMIPSGIGYIGHDEIFPVHKSGKG